MAKFKPAGGKKAPAKSATSAIPCVFLVIAGIALFSLLFYAVLKSGF
jgi:hypothetical protein